MQSETRSMTIIKIHLLILNQCYTVIKITVQVDGSVLKTFNFKRKPCSRRLNRKHLTVPIFGE